MTCDNVEDSWQILSAYNKFLSFSRIETACIDVRNKDLLSDIYSVRKCILNIPLEWSVGFTESVIDSLENGQSDVDTFRLINADW